MSQERTRFVGIGNRKALSNIVRTIFQALVLILAIPALAQAQLVSQIQNLTTDCGGAYTSYGNCKAGEISVSSVTNVVIAGNPTSCVIGQQLTVSQAVVNYEMNTGTRNDLLMWIGNQEGTDPRDDYTGDPRSCSVFSLPSPFTTPPVSAFPFGDVDLDQCADIGGSPTAGSRTFTNIVATCQDNNNNGKADLQILLTWSQNAGQACGTGGNQSFPTVGAPSKCDYNIQEINLDVVTPPTLTLVKQVTNNSGGNAVASAWTLSASGPQNISGATGTAAVTNQTVAAGTYTLSESGPAGYTGTWNCTGGGSFTAPDQIILANATPGQNVTCTVTNDDNPATLTLAKIITNNNGGGSVLADWTLTATGTSNTVTGLANSANVVSQQVAAGNYTLTESGPSGYTASAWSCPGGTLNGNILTLALGQTITCTITNDDQAANLTLTKNVTNDNGGTALPSAWTLQANAISFTSGVQQQVDANMYTLSESNGPSGYTAGTWQCTGGGSFTPPDQLTLGLGQTASCSITNNDQAPSLTLLKDVTNDNGGNDAIGSFALTIAGGTFGGGQNFSSGATPTVLAGVNYTLSETANAGYTLTNIACVDNSNQQTVASGVSPQLSLNNGQSVTCTYFNDDNAPRLTLIKAVTNDDGGTAEPADFDLRLTGGAFDGSLTFLSGSTPTVDSNVSYTLSEITQPFYTNEGVACEDDNTMNPVAHPVSLAEGQQVTCTITNNDQARGSFTVVKQVNNDDGGDATPAAFTLHVSGVPNGEQDCGQDGVADYSSGDSISPPPVDGCTYTLTEDPVDGYSQSGDVICTVNDSPAAHPVAFTSGDTVVCTIANTDDGAMLALTKQVTNDNGGTAQATAWNLLANGPTPQQGDGGFASIKVSAGDYALSESTGPAGYSAGDWDCGAANGQLIGNVLTLANGDDVTCTITNDDISPQLTLTKNVTNDNGGDAEPAEWTLSANAIDFSSGQTQDVDAALYTLSEMGPGGYTQSGPWECDSLNFSPPDQLTLVPGDDVSCSVTNDDDVPTLTLIKSVTNDDGGLGVPESFTLNLTGTDGVHDTAKPYSSGSSPTVIAGVEYTVGEEELAGYTNEGVVCVDTSNADAPVNHPVTLSGGQDVTCTLTNNDDAPTLTLTKIVINDDSGEAQASEFTLTLTGADGGTHDSGVDYVDGDTPTIKSNVLYTLSEEPLEKYELVSIECVDVDTQDPIDSSFTPARGQNIACTVTNDDKLSNISYFRVTKDFTDDNPGEVDVFIDCNTGLILDQTKTITENDGVIFVVTSFDPAELNCDIFENPVPAGYTSSYGIGTDDSNDNPGVGIYFADGEGCHFEEVEGGDFYCTIINTLQATEVEVEKIWLGEFEANGLSRFAKANYTCQNVRTTPSGSATSTNGGLSFEGDSIDTIVGIYPHWNGNSYCTVNEIQVDNAVEPDDSDCAKVPVTLGAVGSCTIYNTLFLEGIPTLSQYGMALLALLMLGMGMVGFRRYS